MDYITTTDLRTKSSKLINALQHGLSVSLIHRSKIIGEISPKKKTANFLTKEDIAELKNLARELNLPKTSYKEREKKYRKHLLKKYGKGVS